MILVALPLLLLVSVLIVRAIGGVHTADRAERTYVVLSPLPWIVSVIVPAAIGLLGGFGGYASQTLIRRSSWVGVGVSVLFAAVGLALVFRLVMRRSPWVVSNGSVAMRRSRTSGYWTASAFRPSACRRTMSA